MAKSVKHYYIISDISYLFIFFQILINIFDKSRILFLTGPFLGSWGLGCLVEDQVLKEVPPLSATGHRDVKHLAVVQTKQLLQLERQEWSTVSTVGGNQSGITAAFWQATQATFKMKAVGDIID